LPFLACDDGPLAWNERECLDEELLFIDDKIILVQEVSPAVDEYLYTLFGDTYSPFDEIERHLLTARQEGRIFCGVPTHEEDGEEGELGLAIPDRGEIYLNTGAQSWVDSLESWKTSSYYDDIAPDELLSIVSDCDLSVYLTYWQAARDFLYESSEPIDTLVHEAAHLANPDFHHDPDYNEGSTDSADFIFEAGWAARAETYEVWREQADVLRQASGLRWSDISSGDGHACGLTDAGEIACWGNDDLGQATPLSGPFVQIASGDDFSCGLQDSGTVECWGDNEHGQTEAPSDAFQMIAAGGFHACGIGLDGGVSCWGKDTKGQASPPEARFISMGLGFSHGCGITDEGALLCWGDDDFEQCRPPSGSFLLVDGGSQHTCGLKEDSSIECWGCGGSKNSEYCIPPESSGFAELTSRGRTNYALTSQGEPVVWGYEHTTDDDYLDLRYSTLSSGNNYACGITDDYKIACWGCSEHPYGEGVNQGQCESP